jgi:hypothetical protein
VPVTASANQVIRSAFAGWQVAHLERTQVPSDTRALDVLLVLLVR